MTDNTNTEFNPADYASKVSKFAEISKDALPTFTYNKKGGYLEDEVEKTIDDLFNEKIPQLVAYHNETVNVYKTLLNAYERQSEELKSLKAQADTPAVDPENTVSIEEYNEVVQQLTDEQVLSRSLTDEKTALERDLRDAENRIEELQQRPAEDKYRSEAESATGLLAQAQKLAESIVSEAHEKAEDIVREGHDKLSSEAQEIKDLETRRKALYTALLEFHNTAIAELNSKELFEEDLAEGEVDADNDEESTVESEGSSDEDSEPEVEVEEETVQSPVDEDEDDDTL